MRYHEIIFNALNKLETITGITSVVELDQEKDGEGFVELKFNNNAAKLILKTRKELRIKDLEVLEADAFALGSEMLIISHYIPSTLKIELRKKNISYLEVAGNCMLKTDEIFIFINDQQVTPVRIPITGKLWKVAGLRFLFAVLNDVDLLKRSYRTIAEKSNIALGAVGGLVDELKRGNYIDENMVLPDKREVLIEKWATQFELVLKPRLHTGRFRFSNQEMRMNWQNIKVQKFLWGGEIAGEILVGRNNPTVFTAYSNDTIMNLINTFQMVPDPEGEIYLYEQFWIESESDDPKFKRSVPALVAYADLINSFNGQNINAAGRIKSVYLK